MLHLEVIGVAQGRVGARLARAQPQGPLQHLDGLAVAPLLAQSVPQVHHCWLPRCTEQQNDLVKFHCNANAHLSHIVHIQTGRAQSSIQKANQISHASHDKQLRKHQICKD